MHAVLFLRLDFAISQQHNPECPRNWFSESFRCGRRRFIPETNACQTYGPCPWGRIAGCQDTSPSAGLAMSGNLAKIRKLPLHDLCGKPGQPHVSMSSRLCSIRPSLLDFPGVRCLGSVEESCVTGVKAHDCFARGPRIVHFRQSPAAIPAFAMMRLCCNLDTDRSKPRELDSTPVCEMECIGRVFRRSLELVGGQVPLGLTSL